MLKVGRRGGVGGVFSQRKNHNKKSKHCRMRPSPPPNTENLILGAVSSLRNGGRPNSAVVNKESKPERCDKKFGRATTIGETT